MTVPTVAFPPKMSKMEPRYDYRPPMIGEHSREATKEWLGLNETELDKLENMGAINQLKNNSPA